MHHQAQLAEESKEAHRTENAHHAHRPRKAEVEIVERAIGRRSLVDALDDKFHNGGDDDNAVQKIPPHALTPEEEIPLGHHAEEDFRQEGIGEDLPGDVDTVRHIAFRCQVLHSVALQDTIRHNEDEGNALESLAPHKLAERASALRQRRWRRVFGLKRLGAQDLVFRGRSLSSEAARLPRCNVFSAVLSGLGLHSLELRRRG
mmetsp:Transcript_52438/g.112133  ORF Transcript_52438/g.112133 Transcript_52438/m.112133 type:complete len:203 (+) Transcript_52438:969-1577(+)